MKKTIALLTLTFATLLCGAASADPNSYKMGGAIDVGVPSGVAVGVVERLPFVPWLKFGESFTYTLAPGVRGNVLLDFLNFPIAPVANIDLGHQFPITVPTKDARFDFSYVDLQIGGALGRRDGARFMILGGMTHIFDGTGYNVQSVLPSTTGLSLANPHFSGWIPNAKLAVEWLF